MGDSFYQWPVQRQNGALYVKYEQQENKENNFSHHHCDLAFGNGASYDFLYAVSITE